MRFLFLLLSSLALSSLHAQYALDPSFGNNSEGFFWSDAAGADIYHDCAIGQDEHIYFTGWTNAPIRLVLGSLNEQGGVNLDYAPNFNRIFPNPTGYASLTGQQIALQSDDSPIMAGLAVGNDANVSSLFVMKANQQGLIDPFFGENGYFFFTPDDRDFFVGDVIIGPADEIFILGRIRDPGFGNYHYLIVKLMADGQLDASFADGGILEFNASSSQRRLITGLLMEDGSLIVAGTDTAGHIFRINADGSIDNEFADIGKISFGGFTEILALRDIDDDFYAFGNAGGVDASIYRFDVNGLDTTYADSGVADLGFTGFTKDALIDTEGRIFFTGFYLGEHYLGAAHVSGALDEDFLTNNGGAIFSSQQSLIALFTLDVFDDGRIVAGGHGTDLFSSGSSQDFMAYLFQDVGPVSALASLDGADITFGPNPCRDVFYIDGLERGWDVQIIEVSGKTVVQQRTEGPRQELNLSSLPAGAYQVILRDEQQQLSIPLIKL